MSDTPDVDSAARPEHGLPGSEVINADFARRIRRECNTLKEELSLKGDTVTRLSGELSNEASRHERTKKNLETQLKHALALKEIIAAICLGTPFPANSLAAEELAAVKDFRKNRDQTETARNNAEAKRLAESTETLKKQTVRIAELIQEVKDLSTHVASLQELNFELAANALKIEDYAIVLAGVTDDLLTLLPK